MFTFRVFLRPSDSSFEASFYCVRRTKTYTHLKKEGAQSPFFQSGKGDSLPMLYQAIPDTDDVGYEE